MISWRVAAAWLVAVVLTTALTWQIVGLADSQVGDNPVIAPALSSTMVPAPATTVPGFAAPSTSMRPDTTAPGATTGSSAQSSTSSTSSGSTPSSAPTTSTTAAASWTVQTISSPGGIVVVRYRPEVVELQAATPAAGYSVEIDEAGPPRVRVDFESDDGDVRVEARWEDGDLEIRIDD